MDKEILNEQWPKLLVTDKGTILRQLKHPPEPFLKCEDIWRAASFFRYFIAFVAILTFIIVIMSMLMQNSIDNIQENYDEAKIINKNLKDQIENCTKAILELEKENKELQVKYEKEIKQLNETLQILKNNNASLASINKLLKTVNIASKGGWIVSGIISFIALIDNIRIRLIHLISST